MKRRTRVHWTISLALLFFHVGLIWVCVGSFAFGQGNTPPPQEKCAIPPVKLEIGRVLGVIGCGVASGVPAGAREMIVWHKNDAEKVFGSDHSKWDPDYTWRNKYKNGDPAAGAKFPGSTSVLVWVTDPYHAFDFADKTALVSMGFVIGSDFQGWRRRSRRDRWKIIRNTAIYSVIGYAARGLAFHAVYSGLPQLVK